MYSFLSVIVQVDSCFIAFNEEIQKIQQIFRALARGILIFCVRKSFLPSPTNLSRVVLAKWFLRVAEPRDVLRSRADGINSQVSTNDRFSSDNYCPTLKS